MADLTTLLSKFLTDLYAGVFGSTVPISIMNVGNGTVGAPSYTFAASPTTGIWRPAADTVGITASGAAQLRIVANNMIMRDAMSFGWSSTADPQSTPDVTLSRDSAAGVLAMKVGAAAQTLRIYGTTTGPKYFSLSHDGTNGVIDTAASSGLISIAPTNATSVTIGKAVTSLAGVATAGAFGMAPIVAVNETTGNTGAVTNTLNYTPASAASTYEMAGVVNVTAWTTPASFTIVITYKDASGNARTDTALAQRGSTGASAAAVTAIDRWYFEFPAIDIDASGTAITLSTTGTFTGSPVYNFAGILKRIR